MSPRTNIISIALAIIGLFLFVVNDATTQSFDIMTYNIRYDNPGDGDDWWENRKSELADLLLKYHPAILGIQEGLKHQVDFIDYKLPDHTYVGVGRDDGNTKGEYCALFYDTTLFYLEEESTFWLSETPDKISVGWDAALERICTYAVLEDKISGDRIFVLNTHFDHLGEIARERSAQLISTQIEKINDQKYPVILMGDFNSLPSDPPILILLKNLADALSLSPTGLSGPPGTFNGFTDRVSERRIDYVFTQRLAIDRYLHIDDLRSNGRQVSDHLAVLTKVKIIE